MWKLKEARRMNFKALMLLVWREHRECSGEWCEVRPEREALNHAGFCEPSYHDTVIQ